MKTVCVYHSIDLDGWMSAAIVKHWWKENNIKNGEKISSLVFKYDGEDTLISSKETITFIGYNYGQPIPDLSEYDRVIMCDISFPYDNMKHLIDRLGTNFIWIDHHISAINTIQTHLSYDINIPVNGIRDTKFAACELTWMYFFSNESMPEIVRLLGRYDCFGHKGTDEELKVLEFQYGARQVISNYQEAYEYLIRSIDYYTILNWNIPNTFSPESNIHEQGKIIYQYLCTEAKQVYKNGFEITFNSLFSDRTKFICINKERFNPLNFGIDYHKDGYDGVACFHYANGKWNFSLYNDNGNVDCSAIAKQYGGGGHKGAAGFIIDDINDII